MPNRELSKKWMEYAKMDYDVAVHDITFCPLPAAAQILESK